MASRLACSTRTYKLRSVRLTASPSENSSADFSTVTKQLEEIAQISPTDVALLMLMINKVHRRDVLSMDRRKKL